MRGTRRLRALALGVSAFGVCAFGASVAAAADDAGATGTLAAAMAVSTAQRPAPRLKPAKTTPALAVRPDYALPLPLTHKLHRQPVGRPYRALGRKWTPRRPPPGYTEAGRGSWYGKRFHGRLTSSGEVFSMHDFTAAHKTLPFDTFVRVTLPRTGKSVVVRINDRGPFVADRVIDLSRAVADELGMRQGVGSNRVVVEVLE